MDFTNLRLVAFGVVLTLAWMALVVGAAGVFSGEPNLSNHLGRPVASQQVAPAPAPVGAPLLATESDQP